MNKILANLVIRLLRSSDFSLKERTKLVTALLDKLNFIPYKDIIEIDQQGRIMINGQSLPLEKAIQIKESAKAVLDNQCRNLVREQVAFKAVTMGVHNGTMPEQLYWCRTALWIYQQEDELYRVLAQE